MLKGDVQIQFTWQTRANALYTPADVWRQWPAVPRVGEYVEVGAPTDEQRLLGHVRAVGWSDNHVVVVLG
jgi:hypothetical protein